MLRLGVVTAKKESPVDIEHLVRQADEALYFGKSQGRNCVIGIDLNNPSEGEILSQYVTV